LDLISKVLRPLLDSYLGGKIPLANFKTEIDIINKKHEYWGFKGIKGQMFFNMIVNVSTSPSEKDQELKAAIIAPASDERASPQLAHFGSYVQRLGEAVVEAGVQVTNNMNLWMPSNSLATDYIAFKNVHEELAVLFSHESGKPFGLYDVEHVLWVVGGNPFRGDQSPARGAN
jgi:hypothetical protein